MIDKIRRHNLKYFLVLARLRIEHGRLYIRERLGENMVGVEVIFVAMGARWRRKD